MKAKSTLRHFLVLAASSLLVVSSASAQTSTWTGISGNWSDTTNPDGVWSGGTPANGADNSANFTGVNITANETITLDTDRTIGNITFTDATTVSHGLTISGSGILSLDRTSGTPTITVTNSGTAPAGQLTISSNITGSDGLTKAGAGRLVLSGDNTYTGVTTHVPGNGIIIVASNNALGSTAAGSHTNITLSNGDNQYIGINNGVNTPENFTISGSSNSGSTAIRGISGTATLSGTITLAGSGQIRLGSGTGGNGALIWAGTITQSTTSNGLVFYGNNTVSNAMIINGGGVTAVSGTVTLNGVNPTDGTGLGSASTYGGNFTLGVTNALRTDGDFSFAGGTSRLNLNGNNQTIKGLISTANTNWTVNNDANNGSTSTLTVGNGGGDYSFGGRIINATTGNGIVALTKIGTGTQALTGANTYTGATTITEGTLKLGANNVLPNGSAVSIGTATLDADTRTDTAGTLNVTGSAVINLGTGAALGFANSSAGGTGTWAGTLNLVGFVSGSSLNFGSSTGLTAQQLGKISAAGFSNFSLDAEGDLIADTGGGSAYDTWSGGAPFDGDANGDGVSNGLAFLLGAATPGANATGLLPTTSQTGGNLVMSFTCLTTADRGTATLTLEYDGDLAGTWLSAPVPGAVGAPNPIVETTTGSVSFTATDGGTNTNGDALINVVATISDATESASGKIFSRLKSSTP